MNDVIVAMKFGRFGREDNTLIMVSKNGALTVLILKRTAKFTIIKDENVENTKVMSHNSVTNLSSNNNNFANVVSGGKLIVPKKTKLFVDQTMRERDEYLGK